MLILYSTWGCHLCEQAAQLLQQAGLVFREVDIVDSPVHFALYRSEIPVLCDGARELKWPFDAAELQAFVGQHC